MLILGVVVWLGVFVLVLVLLACTSEVGGGATAGRVGVAPPGTSASQEQTRQSSAAALARPHRSSVAPRPTPATLPVVAVQPTVPGYSRAQFGPAWTDRNDAKPDGRNGCDTRSDVLREQLTQLVEGGRCKVLAGHLADPYTGVGINYTAAKPSAVQVDHIVPLHMAWNLGAWRWAMARRVEFANDTVVELLAVSGRENERKGDDGPSGYMPPNRGYWCIYAQRFTDVLRAYSLPIVQADLTVIAAIPHCGARR